MYQTKCITIFKINQKHSLYKYIHRKFFQFYKSNNNEISAVIHN